MPQKEFSLPPLLNDSIQGRLDFIMLRPVLIIPLLPHQELEVKFTWWGSNFLHYIRFLPNIEEVKLVFNIHCDLKGLQRYFDDSPAIEIEVAVSAAPVDKGVECVKSLDKNKSLPCRYTKYQLKNKKQWKSGEYVGKFVISKIHFNTRGEFVDECDIFNASGEHCGAVVIFMLHTDLKYNVDHASHKEESQIRNKDHPIRQLQSAHSSSKNKSIEKIFPSEKLDSPRFIPFERGKNDSHKKYNCRKLSFSNEFKKVNSPQKRTNLKESRPPNNPSRFPVSPDSTCTQFPVAEYERPTTSKWNTQVLPMLGGCNAIGSKLISQQHVPNSTDENFILTKLFSFVDSGAIQPSDLPALIQICQGRCPSLEFDSSELNLTYHESMDEPKVCQPMNPTIKVSAVGKRKKSVNFSTISHTDTSLDENPKDYRVFDDKFMSLLAEQKVLTQKSDSSPSYKTKPDKIACPLPNNQEIKNCSATSDNSKEDSTVFILMFHSIQLTPDGSETGSDQKRNDTKTLHKTKVRQRSRLCYFMEVLLEFEEMDQSSQSALYISRRVENEEVIYDENRVFRLLNSPEELLRSEPYLKFNVSRRRLGNRLRQDVGVGIIRLKQLLGSQNRPVVLPLWATGGLRASQEKGKLEIPVGNLNFSVAFAYATVPQQTSKEPHSLPSPTREKAIDGVAEQSDLNGYIRSAGPVPRMDESSEISDLNYPTCKPVQEESLKGKSSQTSLLVENSGCINFVPGTIDPQGKLERAEQDVHLEILEGNGLPLLRRRGMQMAFPPSSYVQTTLKSIVYCTGVVANSSSPKWNYTADFILSTEDLKDTNSHLVLKLFHRLGGASPPTSDPMLGFATIDTHFLWSSFVSLCGWIPILNMEGEVCGEIKISLTPKLRSPGKCEQREKGRSPLLRPRYHSLDMAAIPDSFDQGTQLPPMSRSASNFVSPCRQRDHHCDMVPPENFPSLEPPLNRKTTLGRNLNISEETPSQEREGSGCALLNERPKSRKTPASGDSDQSPTGIRPPLVDSCGKDVPLGLAQVIEGLQWMNHANSFDTPCVSYLDLGNPEPTKNPQNPKKVKKQRRRIAANLNFF